MKLIVAVVNSDDSRTLIERLMRHGHSATVIGSTGGFLREGNTTIVIGAQEDKLEDILFVIRQSCHTRKQFINPLPPVLEPGELQIPSPIEVQVGGATVFVLSVERFEKY